MNILVTGGAGFIGSHLVERLVAEGHSVVCLDNFDEFYDPAMKRRNLSSVFSSGAFELIEGDIRDQETMDRCFVGRRIESVIHLAAKAGVRPSLLQPELYFDVNVMGTLRLLQAMQHHAIRRLIFASSSSVYGNNATEAFSERDRVDNPISPYAATKKAGELLCYTFSHLYSFEVFCLRFFTVYGPRQRPEMAIRSFAKKIMDGKPITIYGDGTSRRDYTYIEDILDGIMKSFSSLRGFEILNLGESETVTLNDLIRMLEETIGKKAVIRFENPQPGDVEKTRADITKARKLIGYDPKWSLEQGIPEFVSWLEGVMSSA